MFGMSVVTVTFTGLPPGDEVAASFQFHYGVNGAHGINAGTSPSFVQPDGTVMFSQGTHLITGGHAGELKAWARAIPSSGLPQFNDPPIVGAFGPCVVSMHLP